VLVKPRLGSFFRFCRVCQCTVRELWASVRACPAFREVTAIVAKGHARGRCNALASLVALKLVDCPGRLPSATGCIKRRETGGSMKGEAICGDS
jgi:hypothetical protein